MEAAIGRLLTAPPFETGGACSVLGQAARHLVLAPAAKRARPRLVQSFGLAVGAPQDGLVDIAVAAELIHAASLLHDDVVDAGTQRRGRPTANALWGGDVAVLSGDLLLSTALLTLAPHPQAVTTAAAEAVVSMSRAALLELDSRRRRSFDLARWRAIAAGKTGALFAWCGEAAAQLAGDEDAARRFRRFGEHAGIAFQLLDDLADFAPASGKDRYADLRNANPSWPCWWAADADADLAARLLGLWGPGSAGPDAIAGVATAIVATGALGAASREADREMRLATEALGPYAERPGCAQVLALMQRLRPAEQPDKEAS